jgi:hypothetical protein
MVVDPKSGYWQVALHPDDKTTAFSTGQGLWNFTIMPFGLCNAPAKFERLMESVLCGLTHEACLDDVIIRRTFKEELDNLQKVFQSFGGAGLKLKPQKCQIFQKDVWYLGHIMSSDGVTTDLEKLEAAQRWPQPRDKHKLRSFLSLCTYNRKFTAGFADIAKPLTQFTEEKWTYQWSPEADAAF